jgi:hypothetical protein
MDSNHVLRQEMRIRTLITSSRKDMPKCKMRRYQKEFLCNKIILTRTFKYVHIYGHMDKYLLWVQLGLMQQLNCVCDMLAKQSAVMAIIHGYNNRPTQILPCEGIVLVVWGNKITGNISGPLCFHASKEMARKYLQHRIKNKWISKQFDKVDRDHLNLALKNKPDMYKIW